MRIAFVGRNPAGFMPGFAELLGPRPGTGHEVVADHPGCLVFRRCRPRHLDPGLASAHPCSPRLAAGQEINFAATE